MNEISLNNISIIKSSNPNLSQKKENSHTSSKINMTIDKNLIANSKTNLKTKTIEHKAPFYPPSTQMSSKSLKKTIAENNLVPYDNEKATLYSTWTPLSDDKSNQKLYDERKQLFIKWFETWNDSQRKTAIEELLNTCRPKQLFYTRDVLDKIAPVYHLDFTRILPRVICLYIFSFLDPRSLCRCSQVSWYWKMLTESDQLWMPKCTRFGWNLNYIPTSFENGIWKQFYIENIRALQYVPIKKSTPTPIATERSEINLHDLSYGKFGFNRFMKNSKSGRPMVKGVPLKQPPWKGNNPNPNHFYRYNYLEEDEDVANERRKERLVKTLALESSLKSSTPSNLKPAVKQSKEEQFQMQAKAIEADLNNQNKIESLIAKGQFLINQINASDSQPKIEKTNSFLNSDSRTVDIFDSNKTLAQLLNNSKSQSSILSNKDSKTKNAWTLLDPSRDDSFN